jgi:hypothetical protein
MTTEKCVMMVRQNGYPNPKLTTTTMTCFGIGWPHSKLTMTTKKLRLDATKPHPNMKKI